MDATGAILLFGLVAVLLLGGLGTYFISRTEAFAEWWEEFRERQAENAARRRAQNEALAAQQAQQNEALAMQRAQRWEATNWEREWGIENPFPPGVVLERAVEQMTRQGWSLQNRSDTTASFARDQGADTCTGCILMLFFLLPGILYLLLANK